MPLSLTFVHRHNVKVGILSIRMSIAGFKDGKRWISKSVGVAVFPIKKIKIKLEYLILK